MRACVLERFPARRLAACQRDPAQGAAGRLRSVMPAALACGHHRWGCPPRPPTTRAGTPAPRLQPDYMKTRSSHKDTRDVAGCWLPHQLRCGINPRLPACCEPGPGQSAICMRSHLPCCTGRQPGGGLGWWGCLQSMRTRSCTVLFGAALRPACCGCRGMVCRTTRAPLHTCRAGRSGDSSDRTDSGGSGRPARRQEVQVVSSACVRACASCGRGEQWGHRVAWATRHQCRRPALRVFACAGGSVPWLPDRADGGLAWPACGKRTQPSRRRPGPGGGGAAAVRRRGRKGWRGLGGQKQQPATVLLRPARPPACAPGAPGALPFPDAPLPAAPAHPSSAHTPTHTHFPLPPAPARTPHP